MYATTIGGEVINLLSKLQKLHIQTEVGKCTVVDIIVFGGLVLFTKTVNVMKSMLHLT